MANDRIDRDKSSWVQSTKTAFDIVEALRERDGAGVTELSRALDLSKSAVHKHLQTLLELGYVAKDGTEHRLGIRFLSLGAYTMERQLVSFGDVRSDIDTLARNSRMTAFLAVADGDEGVVLYSSAASGDPYFRRDDRFSLTTTAAGVSILARDAVGDPQVPKELVADVPIGHDHAYLLARLRRALTELAGDRERWISGVARSRGRRVADADGRRQHQRRPHHSSRGWLRHRRPRQPRCPTPFRPCSALQVRSRRPLRSVRFGVGPLDRPGTDIRDSRDFVRCSGCKSGMSDSHHPAQQPDVQRLPVGKPAGELRGGPRIVGPRALGQRLASGRFAGVAVAHQRVDSG